MSQHSHADGTAGAADHPQRYRTASRRAGSDCLSATAVGGVRLQVSDLARSVAYYEQVLGLRAGATSETPWS